MKVDVKQQQEKASSTSRKCSPNGGEGNALEEKARSTSCKCSPNKVRSIKERGRGAQALHAHPKCEATGTGASKRASSVGCKGSPDGGEHNTRGEVEQREL